jgi:hypothetical protein
MKKIAQLTIVAALVLASIACDPHRDDPTPPTATVVTETQPATVTDATTATVETTTTAVETPTATTESSPTTSNP